MPSPIRIAALLILVGALPARAELEAKVAYVRVDATKEVLAWREGEISKAEFGAAWPFKMERLAAVAMWGTRGACPVMVTDRKQAWWPTKSAIGMRVWYKDLADGDYTGLGAAAPISIIDGMKSMEPVVKAVQDRFCR